MVVHFWPVVSLIQLWKCLVSSKMCSVVDCLDKPQLLSFTLNDQPGPLLYFPTNVVKETCIHSEVSCSLAQWTFWSFISTSWIHTWCKIVWYVHKRMGGIVSHSSQFKIRTFEALVIAGCGADPPYADLRSTRLGLDSGEVPRWIGWWLVILDKLWIIRDCTAGSTQPPFYSLHDQVSKRRQSFPLNNYAHFLGSCVGH